MRVKVVCPECYNPFFTNMEHGSDLIVCTTCRAAFPPDSDLIFEDGEPLLPVPRSLVMGLLVVFTVLAAVAVIISNLPSKPLWYSYGGM